GSCFLYPAVAALLLLQLLQFAAGLLLGKMCGLIDLNTVHDDEATLSFDSPSSSSSSPSSSSSSSAAVLTSGSSSSLSSSSVCLELWHACAGPLISLPKKGSVVVYFPQGHLEHVSDFPAATYDLPPHVFCRVLDVKLH
ncbi:Arf GTPase arf3, partial [Sarracenia purpurea var. burkii]